MTAYFFKRLQDFPPYPWNIPQTLNQHFVKEVLSFRDLGMFGVLNHPAIKDFSVHSNTLSRHKKNGTPTAKGWGGEVQIDIRKIWNCSLENRCCTKSWWLFNSVGLEFTWFFGTRVQKSCCFAYIITRLTGLPQMLEELIVWSWWIAICWFEKDPLFWREKPRVEKSRM